jgi:hypothetical protein
MPAESLVKKKYNRKQVNKMNAQGLKGEWRYKALLTRKLYQ